MKTIKLLGYAFFTMLLSVSFSACGGDDDSGSGGGTPSTNKRLVKITEKGESNTYTYEYTYLHLSDLYHQTDGILYK